MQLAIPQATYNRLRALREQAAVFERYRGFDRCMRRLTVEDGQSVSLGLVAELYAHWGDPLSQSSENYLRSCLTHAARSRGPMIQCGASLLTLVIGRLCDTSPDGPKQLWCLEHDAHWGNTIRSWLTQYRIGSAHVITSRPHLFDGYAWYAADTGRLANDISLVLCSGARATPSGILGALARLGSRLADDCTVLARNVVRADDLKHLSSWAKTRGASFVVVDRQEGFVKMSLSGHGNTDDADPGGNPAPVRPD